MKISVTDAHLLFQLIHYISADAGDKVNASLTRISFTVLAFDVTSRR